VGLVGSPPDMPWNLSPNDSEILAIHAALLPNGKILYFGGDQHFEGGLNSGDIQNTRFFVADGTIEPAPSPTTDVFCSGHAFAGDGRLVVAGGTEEWGTEHDPNHPHAGNFGGERACWMYYPRANEWRRIADMHFEAGRPTGGGRWYPTVVTLGNGEVCAFSGHPSRKIPAGTRPQHPPGDHRHNNDTPERYSPGGNFWTLLSDSVQTATADGTGFYPRVHLLSDGRLFFVTQVDGQNRFYNAFDGSLSGPEIDLPNIAGYDGWDFASVLLPLLPAEDYRPKILIAGGPEARLIDLGDLSATPSWQNTDARPAATLNVPRQFTCGVMLPTGDILITGGVSNVNPEQGVMESELYTPPINWATGHFTGDTGSWALTDQPTTVVRNYHSTAMLLPDGRVWTAGSSKDAQPGDPNDPNATFAEKRIEIYSPPYVGQPRPAITAQPAFLRYGQSLPIEFAPAAGTTIQRVALLRCGSATHAFDPDQRYVGLDFQIAGTTITATAPPNGNVAPPGYYMLWIVDSADNPCALAPILRLGAMRSFFLSDRSSFSVDEVNAVGLPATFPRALYFVVEGCLPHEIASIGGAPAVTPAFDSPGGMAVTSVQVVANGGAQWELSTQPPDVPQRVTFAYDIVFDDASAFAATDFRSVWVTSSWGPFSADAELRLTSQPNPYMLDGPTEWLSTDVRVFQIQPNQMPHGVIFQGGDTPFTFLQRQLDHFNTPGNTAFDGIHEAQDDSPLELAQTVGAIPLTNPRGTPVFNYAIARVRYRALSASAPNVRVFFRMFNSVGTAIEFDSATTYARHETVTNAVPLLGRQGSTLISIPFFSEPRVTPGANMQSQPDGLNVHTLTPAGADEFVWHYGAFIDINQPAAQFPRVSTSDGPFNPADCDSIQTLVADQHQCLVAEVFFDPPDLFAPDIIQPGDTPGSSDKLSQRNLAIVRSANPGSPATRTIAHTFEVQPSSGATAFVPFPLFANGLPLSLAFAVKRIHGPDELIFTWNNLPRESTVILYFPSIEAADILRITATRPGPAALEIQDAHTIRVIVGDISYVPLPGGRAENIAGLLSVELPHGVEHGQLFTVLVQQYSGITRQIIGAFQLNIPVRHAPELLSLEIKRLSLLRWIFEHMPSNDRWYPVFLRYLGHIADRVRGFGGDPDEVAPSPHGTGLPPPQDDKCCPQRWLLPALLAPLIVLLGLLPAKAALVVAALGLVILVAAFCYWRTRCRIALCDVLAALLLGVGVGVAVLGLAVIAHIKIALGILVLGILVTGALILSTLLAGCWGECWCGIRRTKNLKNAVRRLPTWRTPELPADLQFRQERRPAKTRTVVIDRRDHGISAVGGARQGD
jgi:hypothetical protein